MTKSGLFAHFQSKNLQIEIIKFAASDFTDQVVLPVLRKSAGIDCVQFAFDLYSLIPGYHDCHVLLCRDSSRAHQETALDRLIKAYQ
jgi:hypothetical protein